MTDQEPLSNPAPDSRPWILYGPTLRSRGGLASLSTHTSEFDDQIIGAVLPADIVPHWARSRPQCDSVGVSGHWSGARALRQLTDRHPQALIFAVQNPVVPIRRLTVSLIQNYQFVVPLECLKADPSASAVLRVVLGTIGTTAQVALSRETVVLNSAHPAYWKLLTRIRLEPNYIAPHMLRHRPLTDREPVIAYVGSYDQFRGLHIAIRAFCATGLAEQGWIMVVHANSGQQRYEDLCKALAGRRRSIVFADASSDPQHTLARASAALFPSRVEGSSLAFLEAVQLVPKLLAMNLGHFREAHGIEACDVRWMDSWSIDAWREALVDSVAFDIGSTAYGD